MKNHSAILDLLHSHRQAKDQPDRAIVIGFLQKYENGAVEQLRTTNNKCDMHKIISHLVGHMGNMEHADALWVICV